MNSTTDSPAAAQRDPSDWQCFRKALLVTVVFFVTYFALFVPSFQTNDDPEMCLAVLGQATATKPDWRIQYSHHLIGKLLVALREVHSGVNWYGVYLLASHAVSVLALVSLAYSPSSRTANRILLVLYLAVVEVYSLNSLQFTSTSALVGAVGILLLLRNDTYSERRSRAVMSVAGIFLVVLSSMIRWDALFLAVAFLTPVVLAEILRHWRAGNRQILALLAICGVAVGVSRGLQDHAVNSDAEWKAASDHIRAVARLIGYKYLPFEENRDVYASAGWTAADYHMLNWCVFSDGDVFSVDVLTEFVEQRKRPVRLITSRILAGTVGTIVMVCRKPVLLAASLIALAACFAGRENRLSIVLTLAFAFPLTYSVLAVANRCPIWVQYPILTSALLVAALPMPAKDRPAESASPGLFWGAAALLVIGSVFYHRDIYQHVIVSNATSLAEIRALSTRDEKIYVAPVGFPLLSIPVLTSPELSEVRIAFLATGQLYPWANKLIVDGQPQSIRGLVNSPSAAILLPKDFNGFGPAVTAYLKARFNMDAQLKTLSRGKSFDVVSVVVKESDQQQE